MTTSDWFKSTYSNNTTACVEARWTRSPYSGAEGNCLETRRSATGVDLRDSKDISIPGFSVGGEAWQAFVSGPLIQR